MVRYLFHINFSTKMIKKTIFSLLFWGNICPFVIGQHSPSLEAVQTRIVVGPVTSDTKNEFDVWFFFNKSAVIKFGPFSAELFTIASKEADDLVALGFRENLYKAYSKNNIWFQFQDETGAKFIGNIPNQVNEFSFTPRIFEWMTAYERFIKTQLDMGTKCSPDELAFLEFHKDLLEKFKETDGNIFNGPWSATWTHLGELTISRDANLIYSSKVISAKISKIIASLDISILEDLGVLRKFFGFRFNIKDGIVVCSGIIKGSSADNAGIRPGNLLMIQGMKSTTLAGISAFLNEKDELLIDVIDTERSTSRSVTLTRN